MATKTGLGALKIAWKKLLAHEAIETTGTFVGNKITDKNVKPKPEDVQEIIILLEEREEILNEF